MTAAGSAGNTAGKIRNCHLDRTAFDILGTDNDEDGMPRYYQIGRMDMLFGLVNAGKLTLDEAANFIGMAWGDAADMLQGWIESRWR